MNAPRIFQNVLKTFFIILTILTTTHFKAYAFPDTVRHGYTNCTTCHQTPAGGGLLTNYGRSLSKELMSTWGGNNEELVLHGLFQNAPPEVETYALGGDIRYLKKTEIEYKDEGEVEKEEEGFLMQAQFRLGIAYQQFKFIGSIGKIENPIEDKTIKLISTEHYILWNPKEELFFRFGLLEPMYGLRLPDHNLWIKSDVDFVPWNERDVAEFIYEGEKQTLSLSGFQSTSQLPESMQRTGFIASFNQILKETSRLGFSMMNSEGQGVRSKAYAIHGTVSFSEKNYTHFEFTKASTNDINKNVSFIRAAYEPFKGFNPFLQFQTRSVKSQTNTNQSKTGLGIIWLPRPHFELMGIFEKVKEGDDKSADEATLLFHYYI